MALLGVSSKAPFSAGRFAGTGVGPRKKERGAPKQRRGLRVQTYVQGTRCFGVRCFLGHGCFLWTVPWLVRGRHGFLPAICVGVKGVPGERHWFLGPASAVICPRAPFGGYRALPGFKNLSHGGN